MKVNVGEEKVSKQAQINVISRHAGCVDREEKPRKFEFRDEKDSEHGRERER